MVVLPSWGLCDHERHAETYSRGLVDSPLPFCIYLPVFLPPICQSLVMFISLPPSSECMYMRKYPLPTTSAQQSALHEYISTPPDPEALKPRPATTSDKSSQPRWFESLQTPQSIEEEGEEGLCAPRGRDEAGRWEYRAHLILEQLCWVTAPSSVKSREGWASRSDRQPRSPPGISVPSHSYPLVVERKYDVFPLKEMRRVYHPLQAA